VSSSSSAPGLFCPWSSGISLRPRKAQILTPSLARSPDFPRHSRGSLTDSAHSRALISEKDAVFDFIQTGGEQCKAFTTLSKPLVTAAVSTGIDYAQVNRITAHTQAAEASGDRAARRRARRPSRRSVNARQAGARRRRSQGCERRGRLCGQPGRGRRAQQTTEALVESPEFKTYYRDVCSSFSAQLSWPRPWLNISSCACGNILII
jgi:hypothetical protein